MRRDLTVAVYGRDPLATASSGLSVFDALEAQSPRWRPDRWEDPTDGSVVQWPGLEVAYERATVAGTTSFLATRAHEASRLWWSSRGPHRAHSEVTLDGASSVVDPEAVTTLAATWSAAVDADFGFIQLIADTERGREQARILAASISVPPWMLEFYIPDAFWGMILGPAYVDLFGIDRIESAPAHAVDRLAERRCLIRATTSLMDC